MSNDEAKVEKEEIIKETSISEVKKGFFLFTEILPVITEYLIKADTQEEAEIEYTHISEKLPSVSKLVDIRNEIDMRVISIALDETIEIKNLAEEELNAEECDAHWLYIQAYSPESFEEDD